MREQKIEELAAACWPPPCCTLFKAFICCIAIAVVVWGVFDLPTDGLIKLQHVQVRLPEANDGTQPVQNHALHAPNGSSISLNEDSKDGHAHSPEALTKHFENQTVVQPEVTDPGQGPSVAPLEIQSPTEDLKNQPAVQPEGTDPGQAPSVAPLENQPLTEDLKNQPAVQPQFVDPGQQPSVAPSEEHKLTLWHNDLHTGPVEDLKDMFARLRPRFVVNWFDHSFSVYCNFTRTCASDPKVVSVLSFKKIFSGEDKYVHEFHQAYRDDPVMQQVDAFVCSHPPVTCRFFIPFDKPIIALFAVPFTCCWEYSPLLPKWLVQLQTFVRNPKNFVAVNNGFLIKRAPVELGVSLPWIPSLCHYIGVSYKWPGLLYREDGRPLKKVFVMRQREFTPQCVHERLNEIVKNYGLSVHFENETAEGDDYWKSIARNYHAVLYCPYTTSQMIFYESYSAHIPIVMPGLKMTMQNEKDRAKGLPGTHMLSIHPMVDIAHTTLRGAHWMPELIQQSDDVIKEWLLSTDYYNGNYPGLIYAKSESHLIDTLDKMTAEDFLSVSRRMANHTPSLHQKALDMWEGVLYNLTQGSFAL